MVSILFLSGVMYVVTFKVAKMSDLRVAQLVNVQKKSSAMVSCSGSSGAIPEDVAVMSDIQNTLNDLLRNM